MEVFISSQLISVFRELNENSKRLVFLKLKISSMIGKAVSKNGALR